MRSWSRPTWTRRFIPVLLLFLMITPVVFADTGAAHKLRQIEFIQLGTSGGNINDGSFISCKSGTLGALVQDTSGAQYILSNNHVLARVNQAALGEDITQPGLIDNLCKKLSTDVVADLTNYVPIRFKSGKSAPLNTVDAAIAMVRDRRVDPSGAILDIGPLAAGTVTDGVGLQVQKSGRTTGHTFGKVTAENVTIDVGYGNGKTARFVDQFLIEGTSVSFSAGGDSGSLITTLGATPQAVGLLFAGNSSANPPYTIGNPIGAVLSELNSLIPEKKFTMVGSGGASTAQTLAGTTSAEETVARAAKRRNEDRLLAIPGVVGVGVGQGGVVEVYLSHANEQARSQIPSHVDQVPVRVIVTGEFQAY